MALTDNRSSSNLNSSSVGNRVVAFFPKKNDAFHAVSKLKQAGFTNSEIGLAVSDDAYDEQTDSRKANLEASGGIETHDRSFWEEVKDFFSGEHYDDANDDVTDFRSSAQGLNWNDDRTNYYHHGITGGGALVTVTGSRNVEARSILEQCGGDLRESGFDKSSFTDRTIANPTIADRSAINTGSSNRVANIDRDRQANLDSENLDRRIQLRGEILRTYKERVKSGEVNLRKEVITENKTVEVPVTREELVIERNRVSGDKRATGNIGDDENIRVPLSEERVRVEKEPVINEEVKVGKRQVQRTERVSDDVRHEELRVDKEGKVDADNDLKQKRRKDPAA